MVEGIYHGTAVKHSFNRNFLSVNGKFNVMILAKTNIKPIKHYGKNKNKKENKSFFQCIELSDVQPVVTLIQQGSNDADDENQWNNDAVD